MDPYRVVRDFEAALAEYTGAPYAVTVNSCTNALFLCLKYLAEYTGAPYEVGEVEIPKRTYVSVPMQILHAGGRVRFRDEQWSGEYQLRPYPLFDAARRFTSRMYHPGAFICVSFHWSKILGIQQGGAILTDNELAAEWFKCARFDGRTESVAPKNDIFTELGWHCYMSPEIAAEGLVRLSFLPPFNKDLPPDDYPDLSQMEIFK